jgi:hypothetical protein
MPEDNDKVERLEEGMNFKEAVDDLKSAIKDEKPANLPEDLIDQMRVNQLVRSMFKFPLGTKVKNRHGEEGYIELAGIDFRGEIYMVNMPNNHRIWYVPEELREIQMSKFDDFNGLDESDDPDEPTKPLPKSDFPDAVKKTVTDIIAETKQIKEEISKLPPADPNLSDLYK